MTIAHCKWKQIPETEHTLNKSKTHFNCAFNEVQELNELTTNDLGFDINATTMTSGILDEITKALDNSAYITVQKIDTVELTTSLEQALHEVSCLARIIECFTCQAGSSNKQNGNENKLYGS